MSNENNTQQSDTAALEGWMNDVETNNPAAEQGDEQAAEKSNKNQHIERLKRERAAAQRENRELQQKLAELQSSQLNARLENIEKALQGDNFNNMQGAGNQPPDLSDVAKYPLGHLDPAYIEDQLEWLSEKKATERAESALQRQQEYEAQQSAEKRISELRSMTDSMAARGAESFDDFYETVVETGLRGEWDLTETTFMSAHDAENGPQILRELAHNKAEAAKVASMTPYQQMRYVQQKDAEISQKRAARKIPQAGEPPISMARGVNSRATINPATDDLAQFEKLYQQEAAKYR